MIKLDGVAINIDLTTIEAVETEELRDRHALEKLTKQAVADCFRQEGIEFDINTENHQEAYRQALFNSNIIAEQVIAERGEG
ncbi:hypothetical protein C1H69_22930 [Billgrantia endophytica]|uniref:Uncharacterized protein n=2 Tax=Billgrantia endophytica TaxID=2033802 RepID=A0A2N7TUE1_9GAMM|nr:hypothetical protein C1H69_22930 [Halomonas endophytica]